MGTACRTLWKYTQKCIPCYSNKLERVQRRSGKLTLGGNLQKFKYFHPGEIQAKGDLRIALCKSRGTHAEASIPEGLTWGILTEPQECAFLLSALTLLLQAAPGPHLSKTQLRSPHQASRRESHTAALNPWRKKVRPRRLGSGVEARLWDGTARVC